MEVLFFGTYDSNYPRNQIIQKGLLNNNIKISFMNHFIKPNFKLNLPNLRSIFKSNFSLLFHTPQHSNADCILNLYPGFFSLLTAKIKFPNKILIYDPFISLYNTFILDYNAIHPNSLTSKIIRFYERETLKRSDIVLTDTYSHAKFFNHEYNLSFNKFRRVFVGADPEMFYPIDRNDIQNWEINPNLKEKFIVGFIGGFIPLQGVQTILEAARVLKNKKDIVFEIVGFNPKNSICHNALEFKRIHRLDNVFFYSYQPMSYLKHFINRSDIQLGIFGNTIKAKLVIPNKAFQAIACSRPLITENTPGIKELFTSEKDVLLCRLESGSDLAEKILNLYEDSTFRKKIAQNGYDLYKKKCTPQILGKEIVEIINSIKK